MLVLRGVKRDVHDKEMGVHTYPFAVSCQVTSWGEETGSNMSERWRRLVAAHDAGHRSCVSCSVTWTMAQEVVLLCHGQRVYLGVHTMVRWST